MNIILLFIPSCVHVDLLQFFLVFFLKDGDVVVDPLLLALTDTFRDPNNVSNLLLLQLKERVKDGVVELLLERLLVQVDLIFKETVLERLGSSRSRGPIKELAILL